jgi:hypothetical protein
MALSIFEDKSDMPDYDGLLKVLGNSFKFWNEIKNYVYQEYPSASEEWKHSGKNYGWGFRLKDKKRAIIYLTPLENSFFASLVFGEKATKEALAADISEDIKEIINSAKVYAEGRGFRILVDRFDLIDEIIKLIKIKLKY